MKNLFFFFFVGNQFVFVSHKLEVNFLGKSRQLLVTSVEGSNHLAQEFTCSEEAELSSCDSTTSELSNRLVDLEIDNASTNSVEEMCNEDDDLSSKILTTGIQSNVDQDELNNITIKGTNRGDKLRKSYQICDIQLSTECQSKYSLDLSNCNENKSTALLFYISSGETQLIIHAQQAKQQRSESRKKVTFDLIGGLQNQVEMVREMIDLPLKHPGVFTNFGKWLS